MAEPRDHLRPERAFGLFAVGFAIFLAVGATIAQPWLRMLLQQVGGLAAPVLIYCGWHRISPADSLGLRRPHTRSLAAALLIGASFWYLNLWIALPVVEWIAGGPSALLRAGRSASWTGDPWTLRLITVALVPAVCEELMVRGAIARSLLGGTGRLAAATAISALLFAALHPPLRMLPAGLFGLALGYAALRSGSLLVAMLMHLVNNLVAAVALPELPALGALLEKHPNLAGFVALGLSGAGFALLRSAPWTGLSERS